MDFKTIFEPFKIKSVEPLSVTSEEQRIKYLKDAHYNPFQLHSEYVLIDFLTDSGTSAMSSKQWSAILDGDEAYAGSKSWLKMEAEIKDLTGFEHILPTHQGRAGERILYGYLGGKGKVFISNTHFDTTRANIEFSGAEAIDIPIAESQEPMAYHPFKGNMDTKKLEELINKYGRENIGGVILTVTNNSGGGQPVSMENAKQIADICRNYKVNFFLDCCRIAENSYYIKHRETGFEDKTYRQIAQEMFSLADGCIMSAKKDGLVNMGGFLALKEQHLSDECTNLLIITEGFVTYGGLSGRDMEAIAIGLREVFDADYLRYRIRSTEYLGEKLYNMGVPLIWPIGGHAVYLDAKAFYPHIPVDQYPGQSLVCELYIKGGIRSVEIGSVMFGKYDDKGKLIPAPNELVRLAIPRRVYTQSHIEYVIEVFEKLIEDKDSARGFKIIEEPKFLRHFTAKFEYV
ncbi:MAG: tryptophanase [Ignavibacteria bacterium]|nr:tryptophanase [Ignavibacteria bacterium]